MKKFVWFFYLGMIAVLMACQPKAESIEISQAEFFKLENVRLLDSPFSHASDLNVAYVMAHDLDRLLAPFLIDAGLEPKAPRYGNWENSGLDGHTGGHFLTSFALIVASTGNEEARTRLQYMLDELERCQKAHGNGYVGGIPGGAEMWEEIAVGDIRANNFTLNGKWVPWYNIHKLFAGLRDAYVFAGSQQALDMLIQLTDWNIELVKNLSDEQIQAMLVSEHGGMNEVFADVYHLTGDEKYLKLARRFSHRLILDPLLAKEDNLTGKHANTQIPKVIGYMRVAQMDNDRVWETASEYFWDNVVNERSISIGGNSTYEHFHPVDDFSSMVESRQGPETCNTYNMMKLSMLLYQSQGNTKYIDYYERAMYNHILGSIHPKHGGLVYFTPMRPQHYRVYSNPGETFWCCVGSGIENHVKYGELIYAYDKGNLFVNLFIPSVLSWEEKGLEVKQETHFPESDKTTLTINGDNNEEFAINIRHPEWAKGRLEVRVNGRKVSVTSQPGRYLSINRKWTDGDKVEVVLPMSIYGDHMPDGSPYMAVNYGPLVLSAITGTNDMPGLVADGSRMGHVAHGLLYPREEAPMLVIDDESWKGKVKPVLGKPLTFDASELIYDPKGEVTELIPFYRLHDARYMLYWRTVAPDEIEEIRKQTQEMEQAMLELEAKTIDQVETGQQQPETEHNFRGGNTETGIHNNRHWRHAHDWFSYDLSDPDKEAKTLVITYFGLDAGREFDVLINGQHLAAVNLNGFMGDDFVDVEYEIPTAWVEENETDVLTLTFKAHPGSIAGGIYHVRLMK